MPPAASPELEDHPRRRTFTAATKLRILREIDRAGPGGSGAILRREGLYSSTLTDWRRQRDASAYEALKSVKRGHKRAPANPLAAEHAQLLRDNSRLTLQLRRAEAVIEEGDRYNLHFGRFALNPLAFDLATEAAGEPVGGEMPLRFKGEAHAFAERVDALAERFAAANGRAIRMDVAGEFVALHAQGLLLWPSTLMFGLSTLGKVNRVFDEATLAAAPRLATIRQAFEEGGHVNARTNAMLNHRYMWRSVVGLRFASTAPMTGPEDFRNHHLQLLTDTVKHRGPHDRPVPRHVEIAIGRLAEHYRHFPDTFGNPTLERRRESGPERRTDGSPHAAWLPPAWREWMAKKDLIDCRHHARALELLNGFLATVVAVGQAADWGDRGLRSRDLGAVRTRRASDVDRKARGTSSASTRSACAG